MKKIFLRSILYLSLVVSIQSNFQRGRENYQNSIEKRLLQQVDNSVNFGQEQSVNQAEIDKQKSWQQYEINKSEIEQQNKDETHRQFALLELGNQDIGLDKVIEKGHESPDSINYFNFKVTKKIENRDFMVVAQPSRLGSDPDIFISKSIQKPNPHENYTEMMVCSTVGIDLCLYTHESFNEGDTIHIGVYCENNCQYTLEIQYDVENKLFVNRDTIIFFKQKEIKIFRIDIPNDINIERIEIEANYVFPQSFNEGFLMRVETPGGHALIHEGWNDGKIALLSNGESRFCRGCFVSLALESPQRALFKISVQADPKVPNLRFFKRQYDIVDEGHSITYLLNLSTVSGVFKSYMNSSNIRLKIVPYSGQVRVYINPEIPLEDFQARYVYTDQSSTDIIVTLQDRRLQNNTYSNLIYVVVKAEYASTYSILPYVSSKNLQFLQLNIAEEGWVQANKLINYKFYVNVPESEKIQISVFTGNGLVDLYVKRCIGGNSLVCKVTEQDIQQHTFENAIGPDFYKLIGISNTDILRINHEANHCGGLGHFFSKCMYAVGIKGKPSMSAGTQYKLIVKPQKTTLKLREGSSEKFHIQNGDVSYFAFAPSLNDKQLQNVKFHFTAISGVCSIYISRQSRYPNADNHEKSATGVDEYLIFSQEDIKTVNQNAYTLASTYYITVSAFVEDCSYSLTVSTIRGPTDNQKLVGIQNKYYTPIELIEGYSVIHTITGHEDLAIFYFDLNLVPEFTGEFKVTVLPILGSFKFYLNSNGTVPTPQYHQLEAQNYQHNLIIKTSDKYFVRTARYYVSVQNTNKHINLGKFLINYSFTSTIITIVDGLTHRGILNPNQYQYYRYFLKYNDNSQQNLQISKQSTSDYVDVFVSVHPQNIRPSSTYHDYSDIKSQSSTLKIQDLNLIETCPQNYVGIGAATYLSHHADCFMYISVYNPNKNPVQYGIQVHKQSTVTYLYDGISHSYLFPSINEQYKFIYQIHSTQQETVISSQSYSGSLELYVKVYDTNKQNYYSLTKSLKLPLTEQTSDVYAKETYFPNFQTIVIKPEQLKVCGTGCSLFIQVQGRQSVVNQLQEVEQARRDEIKQENSFSIVVTSQMNQLVEGQPVKGYVSENSIVYYMFEVNRFQAEILISLTPINSGDPDLVVDVGNDARPTATKYRWASESFKSEHLTIIPEDFRVGESMEGKYVIGVIGYTNCTFLLTVLYEEQKISEIISGINYEFTVASNSYLYLEYYHSSPEYFTIDMNRDVGNDIIVVNTYNKSQDYATSLPTLQTHTWQVDLNIARHDTLKIDQKNKMFCSNCWYLIGVYSKNQKSKISITVRPSTSYQHLLNGKTYQYKLNSGSEQKFIYELTFPEKLVMNFHVYYGEPQFKITSQYYHDQQTLNTGIYYINKTTINYNQHLQKYFKLSIPVKDTEIHLLCKQANTTVLASERRNCKVLTHYEISATTTTPTKYSINVKTHDSYVILTDGVPHIDTLDSRATHYYLVYGHENPSNNLTFNLFIKRSPLMTHTNALPQVSVEFEEFKYRKDDISKSQSPRRAPQIINMFKEDAEGFIQYQINTERGRFHIKVTNDFDREYDYQILMASQDVRVLPINQIHYSVVQENKMNFYEIIVNEPGILRIQIDKCVGTVSQHLSSNFKKLTNGIYEYTQYDQNTYLMHNLYSGQDAVFIKVHEPGQIIYSAVEFEDGPSINNKREAFYRIQPEIRVQGQAEQETHLFTLGYEGNIQYTQTAHDQRVFLFVFYPVYIAGKIDQTEFIKLLEFHRKLTPEEAADNNIKYTLYLTNDELYLDLIIKCGAILNDSKLVPPQLKDKNLWYKTFDVKCNSADHMCKTTLPLKEHEEKGKLFATIRVQIINKKQQYQTYLTYNPIEFYVGPEYLQNSFLITLGIIIIFVLASVIVILTRKYTKVSQTLKVELQDIRHIASLNLEDGREAAQNIIEKLKYGKMNEENE